MRIGVTARRRIDQEALRLGDAGQSGTLVPWDDIAELTNWSRIDENLSLFSCAASGDKAWPPMAMLKAVLLSVWYDLSNVKLAEALDDRALFLRFGGFTASEPTSEHAAFVRFRGCS